MKEKLKITKSFSPVVSEQVYKLNKIPEQYFWCYGSILSIKTQNDQYNLIYIHNNGLEDVYYNENTGLIVYQKDIDNLSKVEKIEIIIPEEESLIQNYLKGITIFNLILMKDFVKNEKMISQNQKIATFLTNYLKKLEEKN